MINLQMQGYAAALGSSAWKDLVQAEVLQQRCVCCDSYLHLSDDEILTDFVVLDPLEADAEQWLLEQIAQIERTMMKGTELVLIRWKDCRESLVVVPTGDAVPSSEILGTAYWNAFLTDYVTVHLDALWSAP